MPTPPPLPAPLSPELEALEGARRAPTAGPTPALRLRPEEIEAAARRAGARAPLISEEALSALLNAEEEREGCPDA